MYDAREIRTAEFNSNRNFSRLQRATKEQRKRRSRLLNLVVLVLGLIAFLNFTASNATWVQCVIASAIIIVSAIPTFIYFYKNEKGIPFMPLWGALHAVYYALPVFTLETMSLREYDITDESVNKSLLIALVGGVLLLAAFYGVPYKTFNFIPRLNINLNSKRARQAAVALSAFSLYISLTQPDIGVEGTSAIINFISQWSLLALAILFMLDLRKQLTLPFRLYLWLVLLPLTLLIGFGSGALAPVMRDLLVMFFIYLAMRHKVPVKSLIVCCLMFIPFMGLKADFRKQTWYGDKVEQNSIEKGITYINMVVDQMFTDTNQTYASSVDVAASRTAALQTLVVVVEATPEIVPYWDGETYKTLLTALIPRLLWPDKPTKTLGQDFGHRYDLLSDYDTQTSWNLPHLVEFYVNFGWLGILVGMPLLGIVYRIIYKSLNQDGSTDGVIVIAAMIFSGLANVESDLSLVFGAIIQTTLLYVIMLRFISRPRI